MKQTEYVEGPEALKNFEKFGQAILQVTKPEKNKKPRAAKSKKSNQHEKSDS